MIDEKEKKYKYEVNFPYAKETFVSTHNIQSFLRILTSKGIKNVRGKLILANQDMITYIVQSDDNLKF